jgi:AraC-like DNA-binding protein
VLRANQTDDEGVLALGQCGIREVVRLGEREGWKRLRSLVAIGSSASILEPILSSLEGANDEIRNFFGELVRLAPTTSRIGDFGQQVGVLPSTLMSRFFRAGLPAPKMYLSMTRLAYAALWFEAQSVSMSAVAYKLGWSSPQSFGRHIRTMLGMTATEFRKELSLEQFLMQYREQLIAPYIETLRSFRPLGRSSHQAATRHGLSMVAEK